MSDFPNQVHGSEGELFHNSAVETVPTGTRMVIEDGRVFRFSEVGGSTALVVGLLNSAEAPSADYTTEVIDTLAAGVVELTGVGATTNPALVNTFINGYIYTDNATTLPLMRIKDNAVIAASGTGTITLYTKSPTAIGSGNTVSYFKNPWRDVIVHATPPAGILTGVALTVITADQYGWLQTVGPCTVFYDAGTTAIAAVGDPVVPSVSNDVDGSISGMANDTDDTNPVAGWQLGPIEADTEQNAIFLRLE